MNQPNLQGCRSAAAVFLVFVKHLGADFERSDLCNVFGIKGKKFFLREGVYVLGRRTYVSAPETYVFAPRTYVSGAET